MYHFRIDRIAAGILWLTVAGCSASDLVGRSEITTGTESPDAVKSEKGALEFAAGVVDQFARASAVYVKQSGLLTDELRTSGDLIGLIKVVSSDIRILPESDNVSDPDDLFRALNLIRAQSREARRVINMYAPMLGGTLVGYMYAIEGMADVMLADLYCSGIPLSYIDDDGHYVLGTGTPTLDVYRTAIALFDSAIVRTTDSVRILQFAKSGKARALLAIKDYPGAGAIASEVDDGFVFALEYKNRSGGNGNGFKRSNASSAWEKMTVSDGEGGNGLNYASDGDPRTTVLTGLTSPPLPVSPPYDRYVAMKYANILGEDPIVVASAVEMRLIAAEVALQEGNISAFLSTLNRIRTSCVEGSSCPTPAPAGIGGVANLPPLEDPGMDTLPPEKTAWDVRVDLLFRERAYWLFLTGHRQGDLRRLIRNYGRDQNDVYPVGDYFTTEVGVASTYGTDVTLPVPLYERVGNPKFAGCIDREA